VEKSSAKPAPRSKARSFEMTGGHPALDLVNTLDWRFRESGPEELLENYDDLVRFTEQTGLMTASDARKLLRSVPETPAAKVLVAVRELREATAEALYTVVDHRIPSPSSVKRLADCFAAARRQEELQWNGEKLEWVLNKNIAVLELPLWLLSLSTAALMTSEQIHLLRECGNPQCRWLFVDTSKNHTRRWCDMKICGNRMKARRFKAHLRAEAAK